jgi:isopenicillin N synthase-like dioxygenase
VSTYAPLLFDLSQESKDALTMRNSEHFFGYNRLGSEFTRGTQDMREQFDFGIDFKNGWVPGMPDYLRMWGDAQVRYTSHTRHASTAYQPFLICL